MKSSDLRCVLVEEVTADDSNAYRWWKVSVTGEREVVSDATVAVRWLETHSYRQAGAVLGQDRRLAVLWLKDNDQPEDMLDALGERIVPATCAWSHTKNRIITTRTAAQIQRQRSWRAIVGAPPHAATWTVETCSLSSCPLAPRP